MSEPYRGYLLNPSGVLIKPMNLAHFERLMATEAKFKHDPKTGVTVQLSGFRIPSQEEINAKLESERKKSREMQQRELQNKKQNASIVMMAPDDATLERLIAAREADRDERARLEEPPTRKGK